MKKYIIIGVCVAALILFAALMKKKPSFLKSSGLGIAGLLLVNISSVFTGIGIGLNLLTVSFAAVLGVPGVILMLVLKSL